jgi:hypothetical protein
MLGHLPVNVAVEPGAACLDVEEVEGNDAGYASGNEDHEDGSASPNTRPRGHRGSTSAHAPVLPSNET